MDGRRVLGLGLLRADLATALGPVWPRASLPKVARGWWAAGGAGGCRLKLHMLVAGTGRLDWLVGGIPSEMPDRYAWLSPVEHVHPGCPPTLLVHGEHDEMAPVDAMRQLQRRLEQAGVPVTAVYLPQTEHGFDVLATAWSPPARTAIHVLERFLAVLAATDQGSAAQPISGSRAEPAALPEPRSV